MGIKSLFDVLRKSARIFFELFVLSWALCSCATEGLNVKKTSLSYSKYLIGLVNDRLGTVDEAVKFYQEAKRLDRRAPTLYARLGFDYIRLKKFNEAIAEFEKVIRLAPDDDYARYVLALLYVQLNDFRKSADQYEKLLAKNLRNRSQNIQLRRNLSQLYFLEGDYSSVKRHCTEILQWDPLDEDGLYMSAMIASEEGSTQQAVEGFKEVLTHYPDNVEAMNALAYLYAEKERELDQALVLAEKAVEYDPFNGAYLDTLGWVYFKIGETDKAIEFLGRASKLMIDPTILNHLGEAYYKKEKLKEAKASWTLSLSLDPRQKDIRSKLKTLSSEHDVRF